MPHAHHQGQPRPAEGGPGRGGDRWLCGLRALRRKRARGDAVSLLLPRRGDPESEVARAPAGLDARRHRECIEAGVMAQPTSLLICALGGEGGGVLTEWLVDIAHAAGYAAQSTSIPGVAQRTGATTYYIEVFPVPLAQLGGKRPVFSLNPVPGALDAMVSSELLETTRQIGNGMSSPDRTLVITSSTRALTTQERMQLGDGRADSANLQDV